MLRAGSIPLGTTFLHDGALCMRIAPNGVICVVAVLIGRDSAYRAGETFCLHADASVSPVTMVDDRATERVGILAWLRRRADAFRERGYDAQHGLILGLVGDLERGADRDERALDALSEESERA